MKGKSLRHVIAATLLWVLGIAIPFFTLRLLTVSDPAALLRTREGDATTMSRFLENASLGTALQLICVLAVIIAVITAALGFTFTPIHFMNRALPRWFVWGVLLGFMTALLPPRMAADENFIEFIVRQILQFAIYFAGYWVAFRLFPLQKPLEDKP
jgi:hypothetical protein